MAATPRVAIKTEICKMLCKPQKCNANVGTAGPAS